MFGRSDDNDNEPKAVKEEKSEKEILENKISKKRKKLDSVRKDLKDFQKKCHKIALQDAIQAEKKSKNIKTTLRELQELENQIQAL